MSDFRSGAEGSVDNRYPNPYCAGQTVFVRLKRFFLRVVAFVFGPDDAASRAAAFGGRQSSEDTLEPGEDASLDLWEYVRAVTGHMRPVLVCMGLAFLSGLLYLHTATYLYTVTMEVAPVDDNSRSPSLSRAAGLASLAGLNIGANSDQSKLAIYLATLQSAGVSAELLKNPEITHRIFQSSWDEKKKRWRQPPSLTRFITGPIKSMLGYPSSAWQPPNVAAMMSVTSQNITIVRQPMSPIVTIAMKNRDPDFARKFLLAVHQAADDHMRQQTLERTAKYIAYLSEQLTHVTSADHRAALIETLSEQETTRMAASASISFAVDVFSPPTPSMQPTEPRPTVVLFISLVIGFLFGAALVIRRYR